MSITAETTVGAIVARRLGRARVFERFGIDYWGGGGDPLGVACARAGADVGAVLGAIAEEDARGGDDGEDVEAMGAGALADHVVATHHAFLRRELPRLDALIERVREAHGARHPELSGLRETFSALREELESHLLKEERVLFPLVKQLEAARSAFPIPCGTVANSIRVMRHEHDDAGGALARLRELTGGYEAPGDAGASFRALYEGLAGLEADLHRHIHKENNVLFPKVSALEAALRGAGMA